MALPSCYPNLLSPDARDQIAAAYGSNIARLREVKQRFDPHGIFSSAIPQPARRQRRTAGDLLTADPA
jgi:hypothetical protein